jgi:hypothetical protein
VREETQRLVERRVGRQQSFELGRHEGYRTTVDVPASALLL